jgi:hypothetical protein
VPWIRSPDDLAPQLRAALASTPRNLWDPEDDSRIDVVDAILSRSAAAIG